MLTDTQVRGAKSGERARRIADRDGLYLQVDPRGGRYWRFNYRFSGKQKTLALGVYPDVSLAKARVRLGEARELLADGIDPSARKKEVTKTFEAVAREWHARWSALLLGRYADYVLKRLEADVFPSIGRMSPAEIPTSAFRDLVKKIEARGALEIARGAPQRAVPYLERARHILELRKVDSLELARTKFTLASALAGSGEDEVKARQLAESARQAFIAAGLETSEQAMAISLWIEEHATP